MSESQISTMFAMVHNSTNDEVKRWKEINYANTSQKKARVTTSISDFILFFTFWPHGTACGILFP